LQARTSPVAQAQLQVCYLDLNAKQAIKNFNIKNPIK